MEPEYITKLQKNILSRLHNYARASVGVSPLTKGSGISLFEEKKEF